MNYLYIGLVALLLLFAQFASGQKIITGKIIDAHSKEPISGASIHCIDKDCACGCTSTDHGIYTMHCKDCRYISVSFIGYASQRLAIDSVPEFILLAPAASVMQGVVVSANRGEAVKRSEAPIAISSISSKMIQETKPITVDQVLNKVSGVNMVSLGNEQHQMSIRQPMTTKSLFLYLQDGIPIRTTGLFNHNALLEMNMAATKKIEVIKGPSSSLYGSEAIGGVVNFISAAPTAIPVLKLSLQGNDIGYKRADIITSYSKGKAGFVVSGYYADKKNGYLQYSDFHKGIITGRFDYRFSEKTQVSNNISVLNYYSDMAGGIDSTMFANKTFNNLHSFTYRKVNGLRYYSTLSHNWNENSKSTISLLFRNNSIGQNPAYRIKDDYRKLGNIFVGKKDLAHGEINESSFSSYAVIAQHKQELLWKRAMLTGGISADLSPSAYKADYIKIHRDSVSRKYLSYSPTDSTLTNYQTKLNNYAAFINFEFSPLKNLRVVSSLRYDHFQYKFDNHLKPSAFSGSPDTTNNFNRLSPKIGFTYNFSNRTGIYANYSEGFVPPQVTEMYTGVKVPALDAATFYNYEVGGWIEVIKNKLSADISIYKLSGTNEIVNVKLDDGTFANQNAGKTLHRGIEFGLNANPVRDLSFRFSGAYSKHEFVDFIEKGVKYDGNQMNNAPNWLWNAELWFRPSFVKGFRIGTEWQFVGSYFMDPRNTARYEGFSVINVRAGYQLKGFELWMNLINATNRYYSYISSKSSSGQSHQLAEPRNITVGLSYDLGNLLTRNK